MVKELQLQMMIHYQQLKVFIYWRKLILAMNSRPVDTLSMELQVATLSGYATRKMDQLTI